SNLTNPLPYPQIIKNIPPNPKFLYTPFSLFHNQSIIEFFQTPPVKLKQQHHPPIFPLSNKPHHLLNTFIKQINQNKLNLIHQTPLTQISHHNRIFYLATQKRQFQTKSLIIPTRPTSLPQTHSTPHPYQFPQSLPHSITQLFPTQLPITSTHPFIKSKPLKPLTFKHLQLSLLNENARKTITHQIHIIFTHFPLSPPPPLTSTQFLYKQQNNQNKHHIPIQLHLFPNLNHDQLSQKIKSLVNTERD
ncbi:NAD(P)/FAD-dependent oxidoreductase, partial [Staphylococcus capitis]|uniref:NAD(P)/FAD-dependent oxidoreductase n=1 Tax=Staphylococcus capitis TaxID=29388 RepID=UPI001642CB40